MKDHDVLFLLSFSIFHISTDKNRLSQKTSMVSFAFLNCGHNSILGTCKPFSSLGSKFVPQNFFHNHTKLLHMVLARKQLSVLQLFYLAESLITEYA